jgi:hypothetical protein
MKLRHKAVDPVRIGFVGVGGMGSHHIKNLVRMAGVEIVALCDIREANAARAGEIVRQAGQPAPTLYTRGETDFERLCAEEDLDLIYTATPWEWHTRVCVAAMENGKHAATEVPAAVTLDECWELVETAEKTGLHCFMAENCCYDRTEMLILNMVRQGVLGQLLHAECGYLHDLRSLLFERDGEALWRLAHVEARNGDLYPTHGLGPVAQWMDINRGNRFTRLVSMGTQSLGLNLYAEKHLGAETPQAQRQYAQSDIVTTLIQTELDQTIMIKHDTVSPRPYSRGILAQGTRGIVRKYPEELVHLEGRTDGDVWESLEVYQAEFEHPLWKQTLEALTDVGGHGNMDYLVDYRLMQCLRGGVELDIDVYDAAAWSVVSALSAQSLAGKSQTVDFPDFTRGRWRERAPLGITGAEPVETEGEGAHAW